MPLLGLPLLSREFRAQLAADALAGWISWPECGARLSPPLTALPLQLCPGNNQQQPDADRVNGLFRGGPSFQKAPFV